MSTAFSARRLRSIKAAAGCLVSAPQFAKNIAASRRNPPMLGAAHRSRFSAHSMLGASRREEIDQLASGASRDSCTQSAIGLTQGARGMPDHTLTVAVLLHRYGATTKLAWSTPSSGRSRAHGVNSLCPADCAMLSLSLTSPDERLERSTVYSKADLSLRTTSTPCVKW